MRLAATTAALIGLLALGTMSSAGPALAWAASRLQSASDTGRPPWPVLTGYPSLDTSRTVAIPGDTFRVYRTEIMLRFKSNVSDAQKLAFFRARQLAVVGVTSIGTFYVRFPDPGPSWQAFQAVLRQLRAQPEIAHVSLLNYTPWEPSLPAGADTSGPPMPPHHQFDSLNHVLPDPVPDPKKQ